MQPTVKERHLSHGLSAQHDTTYFAGTGAIQAIGQPHRCFPYAPAGAIPDWPYLSFIIFPTKTMEKAV
jgi:hypothetical protein